ncbi:F0F1 ATP synthase subunit gamma [Ligilactobacillus agilis]|uniref:F0F1 ATP synthase subunit gamma n=1 Tax=Ligilactobacillus agilis TaxID=1601 RepID=UPI000B8D87CA|nr:F0F1 ATP synthase subunit gamma [Ligilactobacillus agilis]ASR40433.1 F0F1 ATP synthase subunit gamma [Ligilactobacillus agilis]MDM8279357.1 F0F1 ATP synthase subunit gamma [Ligilactobacillus agilis]
MPASLQEVKRRIESTKKTGQITGAMQMVSTAKLSQIQKHAVSYQVYAQKIRSVITHLAKSHLLDSATTGESETSQDGKINTLGMLKQRPVKKTGVVVITSDRGLVGSYNSNVIKQTMSLVNSEERNKDNVVILAIGGTGADFFKKRGYEVGYEYRGVKDIPTFREVRPIVNAIVTMYSNGQYDELYVCYNHFVNTLTSAFRAEKMLPISAENMGSDDFNTPDENGLMADYETEPSQDAILEVVLPQYAESLVYGAILDAKTSEHASSSTAMKSATDNAKDLIASLELQYNRARQSAITTEITEITGAQAALE